eukprot:UN26897
MSYTNKDYVPLLTSNPSSRDAQKLITNFGPASIGRHHVDRVFKELYAEFGTKDGIDVPYYWLLPEAVDWMRDYYRNNRDLHEIMVETLAKPKPNVPVHVNDVAEVFPGKHPRTEGEHIHKEEEIANYNAICSFNVLQQSPQILENDNEQHHVVSTWNEEYSKTMPDGRWRTVVAPGDIKKLVDKRGFSCLLGSREHMYVFSEKPFLFTLERTTTIVVDFENSLVGPNGVISKAA